jgi:hypothetical protein
MPPIFASLLNLVSNDNKTTIVGVVAAALIATKLDWALLLKGDSAQIATAAVAVLTAVFGYYTNKKDPRTVGAASVVEKSKVEVSQSQSHLLTKI